MRALATRLRRARSEPERLAQKACILAAAERVLQENGPAGTTIETVANTAQLAKGTVYLYFDTKDELYAAVLEQRARHLCKMLLAATPARPGLARLHAMLMVYVREGLERRRDFELTARWFRGDIAAAPAGSERSRFATTIVQLIETVSSAIRDGQSDGTIRTPAEPAAMAVLLLEAVGSVLRLHVLESRLLSTAGVRIPPHAAAGELVELLCRGLEPQGPSDKHDVD